MNIDLADVPRASIVVGLRGKSVRCTSVVGGLRGECRRGYNVRRAGRKQGRYCKQGNCDYQSKTHWSSGAINRAEDLASDLGQSGEGTPTSNFLVTGI